MIVERYTCYILCVLTLKLSPATLHNVPETLITPADVAKQLGVSTMTVRRHVDAGELKCVYVGRSKTRRRMRFKQTAVDAFIKKRST